ncbi:MAG: putative metalloprotease CJM1_0395 family protein [Rhodospirillaceae bacterium]
MAAIGAASYGSSYGSSAALKGGAEGSRLSVSKPVSKPVGASAGTSASSNGQPLSSSEREQLEKLKSRDAEVKAHEQAHRSAGGQYAGPPSYTYQKGPDGANYAIGGEVSIDSSAIPKDPSATIAKLRQVQRAAQAPASPSVQDQRVAAAAGQAIAQALSEQSSSSTSSGSSPTSSGSSPTAAPATGKAPATAGTASLQSIRGLAAYGAAAGLGSPLRTNGGIGVFA